MKKTPTIFVLCLASLSVFAQTEDNLPGHYRCVASNLTSNIKNIEEATVEKTGDTYKFTWVTKDNKIFYGTGILSGENISIVFWNRGGMKGVVTYHIETSGNLTGKWTLSDSNLTGDEFCERLK